MKDTNNQVIDQFIIETALVAPVSKIINQLKNGEFRDCDLKWLNNKLDNFVEFTAKTLGITGVMPQSENSKPKFMNDYAVSYYLKYFSQLLDYFKTL
jgi:hypothetical protein